MSELAHDPVDAMVQTALWASTDLDSGEPLDSLADDMTPESRAYLRGILERFNAAAGELLDNLEPNQVAHDLWLTACRHGAGFWDRGLGEIGDRLTELAHEIGGELEHLLLYVNDDGLVEIDYVVLTAAP